MTTPHARHQVYAAGCDQCAAEERAMAELTAGCRKATLQPYVCRCGTAGSRELVKGRAVGGAPRCNNCGRTMARTGQPTQVWLRLTATPA